VAFEKERRFGPARQNVVNTSCAVLSSDQLLMSGQQGIGRHRRLANQNENGSRIKAGVNGKNNLCRNYAAVMPSGARPFQKLCSKVEIKFFMSLSVISSGTFFRQRMESDTCASSVASNSHVSNRIALHRIFPALALLLNENGSAVVLI